MKCLLTREGMGTFFSPCCQVCRYLCELSEAGEAESPLPPLPRPTFGATGSLSYFFSLCMILIPQILQTLKQFAIFLGRFQDIVLRLEKLKVLHETYWSPHEIPFVLWKHSRSSLTFSKFWGLSFLQCYAVSSGMHIFKNVAHTVYDRRKCKMKRVSVRFVCNEGMLPDPLEISLEWG